MAKKNKWYGPQKKKGKKKAVVIILAVVAVAVLAFFAWQLLINSFNTPVEPFDVTDEETLRLYAPLSEEKGEQIDALKGSSKDDTWVFYVYMEASDLEDNDINELSSYVKTMIYDDVLDAKNAKDNRIRDDIKEFTQEVTSKGVDLPRVFYNPVAANEYSDSDETIYDADSEGAATSDLNEMINGISSPNVKVIVQTCGARRYENTQINPNRIQRFLISDEGMKEIYDVPVYNSATPEALADFLCFCNENYDADHKIVVLWDHGSGTNGYGFDKIYGTHFEIEDIEKGLSLTVDKNEDDPYYDAIVFDACLMQVLDVQHRLYGYSKYMFASEESEPSGGLDYTSFLSALSENPSMHVLQLGKEIADSYIISTLAKNAAAGYVAGATYSLVDMEKAEILYGAYTDFCSAALEKIAENPSALGKLSRAATMSESYGADYADYFNTIDLTSFMEEAAEFLPGESKRVLECVDDAVMYYRNTYTFRSSKGMAVYFPARVRDADSLKTFINFLKRVCDSDDIAALYYYKVAGCLNDELEKNAPELKILNYDEVLSDIDEIPVTCTGNGNLEMMLSEEKLDLIQDVKFQLVGYNENTCDLIYYGEDTYAMADDDGKISTNFDHRWLTFDGNILPIKLIYKTGDIEMFSTDIDYNGYEAKLVTTYDAEKGDVFISGVSISYDQAEGARSLLPVKDGDMITIIYETGNLYSNISGTKEELVIYKTGETLLEEKDLADGQYYEYITVEDLRSDTYDSKVALMIIEGGKVVSQEIDESIVTYEKD